MKAQGYELKKKNDAEQKIKKAEDKLKQFQEDKEY